ncbi:MAG: hypothetical protein WAL80_15875 [Xanthobacteraceae bacterium]
MARTPFKYFEILFDDGTVVSATKEGEQLTGSYVVGIQQRNAAAENFHLKANAKGDIAAPATDDAARLLERLGKLGVALYFLPDDRRVRTTFGPKLEALDLQIPRGTPDVVWPAPGFTDTELGVLMEPEVCHGATEVYAGVQA